jgi:uncharacterized protein (TIRG00374 family)
MKKSHWIYLFIILLLSALGFWIAFKSGQSIQWVSINPSWILVSLLLLVLWWLFDSLSVLTIFLAADIKVKFIIVIKSMLIGFFFGAITPFNSGTVPAILLYLKSQKIPICDCLSPVLMKSLLNGITRAIASLVLAIYLKPILSDKVGEIIQSVLILYGTLVLFIYFVLINPSKLASNFRTFLYQIFTFFGKRIKFLSNIFISIGRSIQHSPDHFSNLKNPLRWAPKSFGYIFLFWCAQLSLPFFVLLSIGIRSHFFQTVITQASFYLLQPYLPTPGGSGVAEVGYGLLSKSLGGLNNPQFIFLWRMVSFYLPLACGAIFFMGNLVKRKNNS